MRIEDYTKVCRICKVEKHLSFFYGIVKKESRCSECRIAQYKIDKEKGINNIGVYKIYTTFPFRRHR